MTNEDYCSYEVAKLLKEKGFDGDCFVAYNTNGNIESAMELYGEETITNGECSEGDIAAPTLQMAMKWLREVHNLHIDIDISEGDWNPCVIELENWSVVSEYDTENIQDTYEEAVEYAVKYCLTNLL